MFTTTFIVRTVFAAAAGVLLFAGCATGPTITSNADPQARFQSYRTFAVVNDRAPANPEVTPELIRGARDATIQAFSRKGLAEAAEGQADILVLIHGSIRDRVDIRDWGFSYGRFQRWGWGGGSRYELNEYREGTLLVDVFDGRTRELIWRGSAVGEVSGPPRLEGVRNALNNVINRYPG